MPARIAPPPISCPVPAGSPNSITPAAAPISGSRFRNAPATSAGTRLCPKANRVNGISVPPAVSPIRASAGPADAGAAGRPLTSAAGTAASAAPRNCTAVTAAGSRPGSSRSWATVNPAETSSEASTSRSPDSAAPPPPLPASRATPASDTPNPAHATGRATAPCHSAAMTATMTGTEPISSAAWLTLVRVMPAFCSSTLPP